MFKSKKGQPIALGLAVLVLLSAAAMDVISQPAAQESSAPQVDVLALMAHARGDLPVEVAPMP